MMTLASVTLSAGDLIVLPSTLTRPCSIIASASRREAMPARAMRLAILSPARSPSGAVGGASFCALMLLATRGLDEGGNDAPVAVADGEFRMPLHAEAEAVGRRLDALDHPVRRA